MYHHHHTQQQGPQPFSTGPRPPHHQPPPNQNQPSSNMLSQVMGFPFPRPTQLPDELESALAIRGARDMDHRLIDHMNRPNQHQSQGSGSGISQHGSYGSNQVALTSDNQPGHQQGVDWSSYQPPTKLFSSSQPGASHHSRRQGPQQPPQSSHAGTSISNWTAPVSESPSVQGRHPHGGGSGSGGEGQTLYTPESAGSILASFGLSNEDLEVLSHYPDDQLTPDTLPFILRDIQINKSGNQKPGASTSSSSFSRGVHDMPPAPSRTSLERSHSPEVPSLLTVTQTAGKVIDYGHASRAKDESNTTRETFKRERLSGERTVKLYPSSSPSSSAPNLDKVGRRQVRLEHTESSKHGDQDYRRTNTDHRKTVRSPGREFPPSTKSRNLDRDYRRDGPKSRPPSETKSEASSRRSLSSSSGSNPQRSSKKLPTPTMISDFYAMSPKVYPHTCSLCHTQCDQEKDWVDHVNTVNHTAACRDLRNKYPAWKPNLPSRSGRYGSRALWDPKTDSASYSVSHSPSSSPTPSPPHSKHRGGLHHHRPYPRHHQPRHQHYIGHSHRLEHSPSGSPRSSSSREHRLEKRESLGGPSRSGVKRPHDDFTKFPTDKSRHPSSSKAAFSTKHGPLQSSTKTIKSGTKPGTKTTKMSAKPPPAKKKKKMVTPTSHDTSVADRLVYLTGIPKDASEQEVTDLVGSFGKINNVILMPCSEEEKETGEGQKASVCMMKAEDAQTLANTPNLSIRDQQITALISRVESRDMSSDANNSKPAPGQDKGVAGGDTGLEVDQKSSDEKGLVLITGYPENGWSESDIINLVQPFGPHSDIIQATQVGKVLVSMSDMEIAQEMVKVNSFTPAKVQDVELKMIHVKQNVGLHTPVALYNLLMGPVEPLESCVPVSWSSLVVINNVPNTQTGSSEVQKLVRRFGTVIKTLVLNNMVICEMATPAMALSVYKRFQTFPCIIHNNPLFFSRKPDPKVPTQTKVTTTYLESFEDTSANGSGSQATAAADDKDTAHKENSQSPCEGIEKEGQKEKTMMSTEKTAGEDKPLEGNVSKDELTVSSLAAPDAKPEADMDTDTREKPAVELNTEEKPAVDKDTEEKPAAEMNTEEKPAAETNTEEKPAVEIHTKETPAVDKDTEEKPAVEMDTGEKTAVEMDTGEKPAVETNTEEKPAVEMDTMEKPAVETNPEEKPALETDSGEKTAVETDTGEEPAVKTVVEIAVDNKDVNESMAGNDKTPAGEESAMPPLPKVTQEMVNALLVECRTRTVGQADNTATSTNGEQGQREAEQGENAVKETKEPAKNHTQQEVKKQERERKEREARKEKEARERKERERKAWEKEERTKRERERSERTRRERERREEERRERERRERKRPYSEGLSGSRWTSRSEGYKSSSWRDEQHNNPEVETNMDEGDEESDFPFNMSDFVTVDEVGDVADLPVPMETTEGGEDVPTTVPQDTTLDTPKEVTMETTPDVTESDPVTVPTTEILDVSMSSDLKIVDVVSLSEASQCLSSSDQTTVTATQLETPETETAQKADETSTSELKTPPAAPTNSSNSPTTEGETSEERDNPEKEENVVNGSQPQEQEQTLDNAEQQENIQEEKDKETETPAVETGKPETVEDQTNTKEENVEKTLKTDDPVSSDSSLPPFNPSNPVGMEFLVPKTGFFCKVCNRFFSGAKEAERNHCKTLKHYDNLKKYLQTTKPVAVKPDSV